MYKHSDRNTLIPILLLAVVMVFELIFSGIMIYNSDIAKSENTVAGFWADNADTAGKFEGEGTAESPYQIKTEAQLAKLATLVNSGTTYGEEAASYASAHYELTGPINLGAHYWTPIGTSENKFKGTFDGKGHSINGLYISSTEGGYYGLFGRVDSGTIKNVHIESGNIEGTKPNPTDRPGIGGIAGFVGNEGSILGCYNKANITSDYGFVGGIVGNIYGGAKVEGCYNEGTVNTTTAGTSTFVGGIIGQGYGGDVIGCYNMGTISGVAQGSEAYVGGIAGDGSNSCNIKGCYNAGAVKKAAATDQTAYAGAIIGNERSIKNIYSANYYVSGDLNDGIDIEGYEGSTEAASKGIGNTVSDDVAGEMGSVATAADLKNVIDTMNEALKTAGVNYKYKYATESDTYPSVVGIYALTLNSATVSPEGTNFEAGETLTITADAPVAGKRFSKWTVDGIDITGSESTNPLEITMPSNDVSITADYIDGKYTVSASIAEGIIGSDGKKVTVKPVEGEASEAGYDYGTAIQIKAPEIKGYTFSSWTATYGKDQSLDIARNVTATFNIPAGDVEIVANYKIKEYTINANVSSTDTEGNDMIRKEGDNADVIISPGPNGTQEPTKYEYNTEVTVTAPEIKGYTFSHWVATYLNDNRVNVDLNMTSAEDTPEVAKFNVPADAMSPITIQAKYAIISYEIDASIVTADGSSIYYEGEEPKLNITSPRKYGANVPLSADNITGYTFKNWRVYYVTTTGEGEEQKEEQHDVEVTNSDSQTNAIFVMPAVNLKVEATYEINSYDVKVYAEKGENASEEEPFYTEKVTYGTEFVWDADGQLNEYAFTSWDTDKFDGLPIIDPTVFLTGSVAKFTMPANEVRLVAKYAKFNPSNEFKGKGSKTEPYIIENGEQLRKVRNKLDAHYKLLNDINLTGGFTEIIGKNLSAPFTGSFNGAGHTISNLTIVVKGGGDNFVGLFGCNTGTIKDLTVSGNTKVTIGTSSNITSRAGGIAGHNSGTILNCNNEVTVNAKHDRYDNDKTHVYSGGIAGTNSGMIENCTNKADISALGARKESGFVVEAHIFAGGIVGKSDAESNIIGKSDAESNIKGCKNTGNIYSESYQNKDSITATWKTKGHRPSSGGIVGWSAGKTNITYCESTGATIDAYEEIGITWDSYSLDSRDSYTFAGGILGHADAETDITACKSSAQTIKTKVSNTATATRLWYYSGGIVGETNSNLNITACISLSNAIDAYCNSDPGYKHAYSGGIIGGAGGKTTITSSYAAGSTTTQTNRDGEGATGGIAAKDGWTNPGDSTWFLGESGSYHTSESTLKRASFIRDTLNKNIGNIAYVFVPQIGDYPDIVEMPLSVWENYVGTLDGEGTLENPYQIDTAEKLARICYLINENDTNKEWKKLHYKLTADINLSAYKWQPIKELAGSLDGDGHTITGLNIYGSIDSEKIGLIGTLTGEVKNLNIGSGTIVIYTDNGYAGSIVGNATSGAKISNCTNAAQVFSLADNTTIAGIVAYADGATVQGCGNLKDAYICGTRESTYSGGIAGKTVYINIYLSYNIGKVGGARCNGALVGNLSGEMYGCYMKENIGLSLYKGVGYNTSENNAHSIYVGDEAKIESNMQNMNNAAKGKTPYGFKIDPKQNDGYPIPYKLKYVTIGTKEFNADNDIRKAISASISANQGYKEDNKYYIVEGDTVTVTAEEVGKGYVFGYWDGTGLSSLNSEAIGRYGENGEKDLRGKNEFSFTMPSTQDITLIPVKYSDDEAPKVTISIEGADPWKSFLNTITFGLFFKDTKTVKIEATDKYNIDKIEYAIVPKTYEDAEKEQVKPADDWDEWLEYKDNPKLTIEPDKQCVIYAKGTDEAQNTTIVSSDGIIVEKLIPDLNVKYVEDPDDQGNGKNIDGVWTKSTNVCISATAEDTGDVKSGIKEITYRYTPQGASEEITGYLYDKDGYHNLTDLPDGVYSVFVKATDKAGNESDETKIKVMKDTNAPTGEVTVTKTTLSELARRMDDGIFSNTVVKVEVSPDDKLPNSELPGSGIAKIEYQKFEGEEAEKEKTEEELERGDWLPYGALIYTPVKGQEPAEKFMIYAKITDVAGNSTIVSTEKKVILDAKDPLITGIEDEALYYTNRRFKIEEEYLEEVVVTSTKEGEDPVELTSEEDLKKVQTEGYVLTGDDDKKYQIKVKDKAENQVTYNVTMKPISDLTSSIDDIKDGNVTSENEKTIEDVKTSVLGIDKDENETTKEQTEKINSIISKCDRLNAIIEKVRNMIAEVDSLLYGKTTENIKSSDRDYLSKAKSIIDILLSGYVEPEDNEPDHVEPEESPEEQINLLKNGLSRLFSLFDLEDSDLNTDEDINITYNNLTENERNLVIEYRDKHDELLKTVEEIEERINELLTHLEKTTLENVKIIDKDEVIKTIKYIENLIENNKGNLTDEELKKLNEEIDRLNSLIEKIDKVQELIKQGFEKMKDVLDSNAKSSDKINAQNTIDELNKLLDEYGKNMTPEEITKIKEEIARLEGLIEKIEKVEAMVNEQLEAMQSVLTDNVKLSDKSSIQSTIDYLNKLLSEYGNNLTPEQIAMIKAEIARLEQLLKDIQSIEEKVGSELDLNANINLDNVKTTDKEKIQNSIDYINNLLANPNNLTPEQIQLLKTELNRLLQMMDKINEIQSLLDKAMIEPTDALSAQELIDLINKLLNEYSNNLTDEQKKALEEMLERAKAFINENESNVAGTMLDIDDIPLIGIVSSAGATALGTGVLYKLIKNKGRRK